MLTSIIRTFVPLIVGFLVTLGFFRNVDQVSLNELITAAVSGVYYLVVRFLEHYVSSSFGWLLGSANAPTYQNAKMAAGEMVK